MRFLLFCAAMGFLVALTLWTAAWAGQTGDERLASHKFPLDRV